MSDHYAYINAPLICGTCSYFMTPRPCDPNLPAINEKMLTTEYEPGKPFVWRITCINKVCPHYGIVYEVDLKESGVKLKKVLTVRPTEVGV